MKGRYTKAAKMKIGDVGLLYCSENKNFTVPFVVRSLPEFRLVQDIWPEPWALPFKIDPLGSPAKAYI
jgi:hypothetical protein